MRTAVLLVVFCALAAAPVTAQTPAPPPSQENSAAPPAPPPGATPPAQGANPAAAAPPENYTYEPDGRRDPFLNLLGTGAAPVTGPRGPGAAGLAVAEVTVRGVLQSRGELIAMIQGPDNKTYIVHEGDKFVDGTIRSVTAQGLIIVQDVTDPLSLVKQREIQKLLRSQESAKE